MLWFKLFFGLKIFKAVWFLFSFAWEYDIECATVENKNQTGLKIVKPKKNLNLTHTLYSHVDCMLL